MVCYGISGVVNANRLELGVSELQVQSSNRSAMLPPPAGHVFSSTLCRNSINCIRIGARAAKPAFMCQLSSALSH